MLKDFEMIMLTPDEFPEKLQEIPDAPKKLYLQGTLPSPDTKILAVEYNRDVLAVPGSIFSRQSNGPHMLIRLGATPVTKSEDILEALGFKVEQKIENLKLKYADCSEEEMLVVKPLAEPLQKDELIRQLKLPVSKASAVLSIMEIKGLVEERMGEMRLV